MIDITVWMQDFLQTLNETFANRVLFVGLQGSYGRGEATETSESAYDVARVSEPANSLPDRNPQISALCGKASSIVLYF